jgi:protein phosphatase
LCSDGLFTVLQDSQIAEILGRREATLDSVCAQLIEAANKGGGPDNITTLVLEIDVP